MMKVESINRAKTLAKGLPLLQQTPDSDTVPGISHTPHDISTDMRFSAFIFAAAPMFASAWKLELFEKEDQVGLIYELGGTRRHNCHNLPNSAKNRALSYRWNSDGSAWDNCEVVV